MVDPRIGVPYGKGVNGNRGPCDHEHQRSERQYPTVIDMGLYQESEQIHHTTS